MSILSNPLAGAHTSSSMTSLADPIALSHPITTASAASPTRRSVLGYLTQAASSSVPSPSPNKLSPSPSAPQSRSPIPARRHSLSPAAAPPSSSLDDVVSAAASSVPASVLSAEPAAPSLLSLPIDGKGGGVLSLSDRLSRSPRAASKSIGALWRDSAAAKRIAADSEGADVVTLKDEQPQRRLSADSGRLADADGVAAVKEEAAEDTKKVADESLLTSKESDGRSMLRETLKGSELRRRREGSDTSYPAVKREGDNEPLHPPPPPQPPRPLLRASSRGVTVHSSTAPPTVATSSPSTTSPSTSSVPSPSSSSQPPSLSRLMSRSSTRNLFASLSKSVALFSSGQSHHGQAEEDEENREWLMRRLSKQDEQVDPPSSSSTAASSTTTDLSASWLSAHSYSYVLTFCRERVFPSLLVLLVLIQLIVLPLRLALSLDLTNWRLYDPLLDVLYVLGVLFTDYLEVRVGDDAPKEVVEGGGSSTSAGTVSIHLRPSLSRRMFVFDLLSTLPYHLFVPSTSLISLFADPAHATATRLESLLRLPRILRAPRLSSFLEQLELFNLVQSIISPAVFRLLSFSVWMYLFAHFAGCAWWLTSYLIGLPEDEWVVQADMREGSFSKVYLHLLFVGFKCVRHTAPSQRSL